MPVYQPVPLENPHLVQPQGINECGTNTNDSVDNKLNDDETSKKHKDLLTMSDKQTGQVYASQNAEMSQPLLGGGQDIGQPPYLFGNESQPTYQNAFGSNQVPLPIESLEEF